MELVYIEPVGLWKGLSSELTTIPNIENKRLLDPCAYGGIPKDSSHGVYYVMQEESYQKAQRDCFKFFYRNMNMMLPPSKDALIKDRTVVCNLLSMKFDMSLPETGSMVLRDASPYMVRLSYEEGSGISPSPDDYEKDVLSYGRNFIAQVEKLRCNGNLFFFQTEDEKIQDILLGKIPFILPDLKSLRKYDKHIAIQFFLKGKGYEEICDKVREYSLLPVCRSSYTGFDEYVKNIVAEVIFECQYPVRIESLWARKVNSLIHGAWLTDPHRNGSPRIPCRIVGRVGQEVQVLASDADAEFDLCYSRDDVYAVDQTWLVIRTDHAEELKEAGLRFCEWID